MDRLKKLVDVKSLVTLALTATMIGIIFAQLKVEENVFNLFSNAVMLVLGFFFGKVQNQDKGE